MAHDHAHSPDAPVRPRKQEQEPASPEVTEVAPGVLRAQLPIEMPGLGHVNCYVIEDARGAAIVDPGLPGRKNLGVLTARLRSAGIPLGRVHTVVVTHSHPDHFGGAGWVRHETGADVVTHRRFRTYINPDEPPDLDPEDAVEHSGRRTTPWDVPPWGGEPMTRSPKYRAMIALAKRFPRLARTPQPTKRVGDGEPLLLGDREWFAVHTPGHTEDHVCLFDPTGRTMLSGDHVLPTITPHIGGYDIEVDYLDQFFSSLDKVAQFGAGVDVTLPAHGHPFDDLAGRARSIAEHHRERLERVRHASEEAGRPVTVQEISTHLFSPRAQGTMADSESFAHVEHLRRAGEYRRLERDGRYLYEQV